MFAAIVLAAVTTTASALDAVSAYAPRAMQEQGTPGLSVAITDRTHTLDILTLGVREPRRARPGYASDALRHRLDHEIHDGAGAHATR